MISAHEVAENSVEMDEIMRLMETAFPPSEQAPRSFLVEQARRDEVSMFAYSDEGRFCGFTFMIEDETMAYVLYLAVDGTIRSRGYGSQILASVAERVGDKTLVLDIEPVDEAADNVEQRRRRRNFYLRNGFVPTGYAIQDRGNVYEALVHGEGFDPEHYINLINELPEGPDKTVARLDTIPSPLTGKLYTVLEG